MSLDTMNHEQAVSAHAPERYLLGELAPAERDAFESHYFDCPACFDQLEKDAEFLGLSRETLGPEPEKGWLAVLAGDLRRPAPALLSAALVCALGLAAYQQVQLADARQPKLEASVFVPAATKGAEKSIRVSRKSQLSLTVDFRPASEFSAYRAQIVTESGRVEYALPVAATGQDAYEITIGLPPGTLQAGKYSLAIEGLRGNGSPTEITSGSFDLKFVD